MLRSTSAVDHDDRATVVRKEQGEMDCVGAICLCFLPK